MYDYEEEDEWICAWNDMLERYPLTDNKWLQSIYEERQRWFMVYGQHMFATNIKSTQRSESMNNVLKQYLNSKYNLLRFFKQYTRLLEDRRYKEWVVKFNMRQRILVLPACVEMLKHAMDVYTSEAFKMFQHEYMKVWDCKIHKVGKSETKSEYKVICGDKNLLHFVKFDSTTKMVHCSYMKISFVGILCAHALKVLDKKTIKRLQPIYLKNMD